MEINGNKSSKSEVTLFTLFVIDSILCTFTWTVITNYVEFQWADKYICMIKCFYYCHVPFMKATIESPSTQKMTEFSTNKTSVAFGSIHIKASQQ